MKLRLSQKPGMHTPRSETVMSPRSQADPRWAAAMVPEGTPHEDEGGLGALPEGPAHGTVEKVGLAQIAGEHPTVKTDELLPQGAVQAEGLARRLDLRRRGVGPEHDADRITR